MVLALAPAEITFWQVTLGVGAVVLLVVVALLSLLLSIVGSIETGVQQLGPAADGVADNTANIRLALTVADSLDEVAVEARRHARLLGVSS